MTLFTHRFGRVLMGVAALLGAGASLCPAPVQATPAWVANDDDALLFEVRLAQYRLGDGVRGYQTPRGTCVDLADTIMALDVSIRVDKKLRRATGWAFEERRSLTIDREANTVQIMNNEERIAPDAIYDTPEGWCVDTAVLARWLGVDLVADTSNAQLVLTSSNKLPVQLQLERRARAAKIRPVAAFDLKSLPRADAPYRGIKPPSLDAVVSLLATKTPSRTGFAGSYELYAAGEVGPIAYNARLSSDNRGVPSSLRVQAYRTDPDGGLLGPLKATQIAAGDVSGLSTALVSQGSAGRGGFVTNRPVERNDAFDRTDFRGELPSGWDAELYRNGQLLAIVADRADGRYEFLDVQLLYGKNRFEVVLYGPQGQIRRDAREVTVGADSIRPRRTQYWFGAYQEGRDLIGLRSLAARAVNQAAGWRAAFGIERGIHPKTSAALYGHSLVLRDGIRRNYGEVAVRRAVGPTLIEVSGSATSAGGYAGRIQLLGGFGQTYVSAESILARGGFASDRLQDRETGLHRLSLDQSLKLGRTRLPLHGEVSYTTYSTGTRRTEAGLRATSNIGRLSFGTTLAYRAERRASGPDPGDSLRAGIIASGNIGGLRLRGDAQFSLTPATRFESIGLTGEWSAGHDDRFRSNWRTEIGYEGETRRARLGLGYSRRFHNVAVTGMVEARSDGAVAAGLNLAFSLGVNPAGRGLRVTSRSLATQGQAVARVYRDLNGDGVRQTGEPFEKDVQITAGRVSVDDLTGDNGQVVIDGLEPYQPVLVGIDASSLANPLVQPSTKGLVVVPRPGVAIVVDLPLVSAGEVDGTLMNANGTTFEGVDLELVDVEGRVARTTRSEFDGFFLFDGVPYGRYRLRVAKASAEAARLDPVLRGDLIVGDAVPSLHLGILTANPRIQRAATN
ncbi:MAG: collagen binding domain-containing protein [Sphingomonadaceae bacterium]